MQKSVASTGCHCGELVRLPTNSLWGNTAKFCTMTPWLLVYEERYTHRKERSASLNGCWVQCNLLRVMWEVHRSSTGMSLMTCEWFLFSGPLDFITGLWQMWLQQLPQAMLPTSAIGPTNHVQGISLDNSLKVSTSPKILVLQDAVA